MYQVHKKYLHYMVIYTWFLREYIKAPLPFRDEPEYSPFCGPYLGEQEAPRLTS